MAHVKEIYFKDKSCPVEPLNHPKNWDIFNLPKRIKTASAKQAEKISLGGFDLEGAISSHPDHLYLKIFAIEKDEVNDNGDAFCEAELKLAAPTFVNVPIFTNHQNTDIEKARGRCIHSWYDEDQGGIYIIASVDKIAYPSLARSIEEGIVAGTSMGCSVNYSCCSVCHNRAAVADQYCDHVKHRKNRTFNGDIVCAYHDSPDEDAEQGPCPLCGSKHGESKTVTHKNQKVYEHNYGLKFIENSFVVNPACHRCGVCDILHVPTVTAKIAELKASVEQLQKGRLRTTAEDKNTQIKVQKHEKVAGQKELNSLTESMGNMERVVQSMLAQKEEISMEYVSDLVKAMSDVQNIHDELQEMGYAQLTSPDPTMLPDADIAGQPFPDPQPVPQQPQQPTTTSAPGAVMEDASGLGTITRPKSSQFLQNKKDFLFKMANIREKISSFNESIRKVLAYDGNQNMSDTFIEAIDDGPSTDARRVLIPLKDGEEIFVVEAKGDQILKTAHISEFPSDMQDLIKSNPQRAAQAILGNKELTSTMATTEQKSAAVGNPANDSDTQQEIITEKQLRDSDNVKLHPRTNDTWEQITEAEIEGDKDQKELGDTTSESPTTRKGTYEVITEGQLASVTDGHIARWKDWPEVITEKQWNEFSRTVAANLPDDWTETITEDQLRNLLKQHRFVGPYEVVTEGQLRDQDYGIMRWANTDYSKAVIKIANGAVSDAIALFKKSPSELAPAVAKATENMNKVAFLTILNALPHKASDIKAVASNIDYFNKLANAVNAPSTLDTLIMSVAQNAIPGVKVEDVYDAVSYVLRTKKAMTHVDKIVQQKLANTDVSIPDKFSAFEDAVEAAARPDVTIVNDHKDDGRIRVNASIEEIGVDPKNKTAFNKAAFKFAQEMAGAGETIVLEITPQEDGTVMIELKNSDMATDDEMGTSNGLLDELEGDVEEITGVADENGEEVCPEGEAIEEVVGDEESSPMASRRIPPGGSTDKPARGFGGTVASKKAKETKEAKSRKQVAKEAQMMGGQMGGQGGASQGPGAGATLPTPPGSMDQTQPVESFGNEGPGGEDMGVEDDLEPKPPGSMCVVCGSSDVDIVAGKGQCNNCGSEMTFKVSVDVTRWANLTPEEGTEEIAGGETNEELGEGDLGEGEGFEMPEMAPEVAAMVRFKPDALQKIAETKIALGSISPANGQSNTVHLGEGSWYCLDTGTKYKVSVVADRKTKSAFGQWEWRPRVAGDACPSCNRERARFIGALKQHGMSEADFDKLDVQKKSETVLSMKKAGLIKPIKTASKAADVVAKYKLAYSDFGDKFPVERCLEKLARRFGQNAVAISGPCEGKPLAECVCKSLKSAKTYSTGLAMKVAEAWGDEDGTDCCVQDQVRLGLNLKDASAVCSAFKSILATPEDIYAEKLAQFMEEMEEAPPVEDEMDGDLGVEEVDPFAAEDELGDEGSLEMISLDPSVLVDALDDEGRKVLDSKLDAALGSDPTDDLGAGDEDIMGEISEEEAVPVDAVDEAPAPMEDGMAMEGNAMESKPMQEAPAVDVKPMESCDGEQAPCPADDGERLHVGKPKVQQQGIAIPTSLAEQDAEDFSMKEATHMRSSIGHTQSIHLDLDQVIDVIQKQAADKEIQQENVQDADETKPYSAGNPADGGHASDMMHEKETVPTAGTPSVPRDKALMGHEDEDLNPQDGPQPKVPSENATMGHEDEQGLSGGDNRYTGGDEGQGKSNTASAKEGEITVEGVMGTPGFDNMKDRLAYLARKVTEAKKLDAPKPVADDEDIKPVSGNTTIGHEPKFTADTPTDTETADNSHMGHERESIGSKPTSPKDHPEVPADNQLMGHEEKAEIGPEKGTRDKGTVIAGSDGESEAGQEVKNLAFRVAGTMLEHGMIKSEQLGAKVAELQQYQPAQIKDYEQMMLKNVHEGAKGFTTASRGLEQPLVVNEASSNRDRKDEIQSKLASLFTLSQQNTQAENTPNFDLRKAYGR